MPKLVPVESTMILSLGWDENTRRLVAQFGPNDYYEYYNVPPEIAARVVFAESNGRTFNELVKRNFQYGKINREEALG